MRRAAYGLAVAVLLTTSASLALAEPAPAPPVEWINPGPNHVRTEDSAGWQCWRMGDGYCDTPDRKVKRA